MKKYIFLSLFIGFFGFLSTTYAVTQDYILSFTLSTQSILSGQSTNVSWSAQDVSSVNLSVPCINGIKAVITATGNQYSCGSLAEENFPANGSVGLTFLNTSGATQNVVISLTPSVGGYMDISLAKTITLSIAPSNVSASFQLILDPSSPSARNVAADIKNTDVVATVLKISATGDNIVLKQLGLQVDMSVGANLFTIQKISVWDGSTKVGEILQNTQGAIWTTFNIALSDVRILKDSPKSLVIKFDIAPIGGITHVGDTFAINYDADRPTMTYGVGESSGSTVFSATTIDTAAAKITLIATAVSTVNLLSPNGGEVWKTNAPETISWQVPSSQSGRLYLYFLEQDSAGTWTTANKFTNSIGSLLGTTPSYTVFPSSIHVGQRKIRISNNPNEIKGLCLDYNVLNTDIDCPLSGTYIFDDSNAPFSIVSSNPTMCTADAKQCPDGSYVGRTGPACEFSACPSVPAPTPTYPQSTTDNSQAIQLLLKQIQALQAQLLSLKSGQTGVMPMPAIPTPPSNPIGSKNMPVSACLTISYNLTYRSRDVSTGGDVSALQDLLQAKGHLDSQPTGFFGLMTLAAVKKFQAANGIESTGFVGPLTRAKIKNLTCIQ